MARWVKAFVTKPGDLSSIPREPHGGKRTGSSKLSSDFHIHTWHMHSSRDTQRENTTHHTSPQLPRLSELELG